MYKTDPAYMVDGEYRGRFTPDAEYVLSGQLRKDIGPLPEVPYRYLAAADGYRAEALSPVPEPGVHPRVLMSPSDLENIRAKVALGENADRYFRIVWNDVKSAKPMEHHHGLTSVALVALVEQDEHRGRELAEQLVEVARFKEPLIELLNTDPHTKSFRDNWWYYSRTSIQAVGGVLYRDAFAQGGPERVLELAKQGITWGFGDGSSLDLFNTELRAYDYLYDFMNDEQRRYVRGVIAKATFGRYTAGMELPGNMFINNHMSMGEDLLVLALAIEGEEGYDPRILQQYSPSVRDKIIHDVSEKGFLHSRCKGFLPERAALAITRRAGNPSSGALPLLSLEHLRSMVWAKILGSVNVFYSEFPPDLGALSDADRQWWMGKGSGPWMDQFFNWAFIMKLVYPEDRAVDFFYKERLFQQGFGPARAAADAPLPRPRIRYTWRDIMLLAATDGLRNAEGEVIDYNQDGLPEEITRHTAAYADEKRGIAQSRSSWAPDSLAVLYRARTDHWQAGHMSPLAGNFNLTANGVIWSMWRTWYLDASFRNTVLINGRAGAYPPAPANWMKVEDNANATTFISENTDHYNWRKREKNFYAWHNLVEEAPWFPYRGGNWSRKWELPFHPNLRRFQEGFAGLDWGNWHGETRGPEMVEQWNDVDHAFRTVHMTKGDRPYVLVIDDVRKDDDIHQYDWVMKLESDIALYEAKSSVGNRHDQPGMPDERWTDLILCQRDVKERRFNRYGLYTQREPKPGDPLLLVRVLWRNSSWAYPQPSVEQSWGPARIRIPALAVEPEFRVLLFPFRHGEALPITTWSDDRTRLTVRIGNHTDMYTFGKTDGGRTLLAMERNGEPFIRTPAGPTAPALKTAFGHTPDRNHPDAIRSLIFAGTGKLEFADPPLGMDIRYTLDGSDPDLGSPLYTQPVALSKSVRVKARTFAPIWPFAERKDSGTLEVQLDQQEPLTALVPPAKTVQGLACEVFEVRQTMFEKKTGIFTGRTSMLPDLAACTPIFHQRVNGFRVPEVKPESPAKEMKMGFYRYRGLIHVEEDGVYGFKIQSCGPVVLTVGAREVLAVTGVYGLSEKNRFGEVALSAGWHPLELTVCDPVFWKDGQDGPYELKVHLSTPADAVYRPIAPERLVTTDVGLSVFEAPAAPVGTPQSVTDLVPGLVMRSYNRLDYGREIPADGLPAEQMAVGETEIPYAEAPVLVFESSSHPGRLLDYRGYLRVTQEGEYAFSLHPEGGNVLYIDGIAVTANRVTGPALPGRIVLQPGLHAFNVRLAGSKSVVQVKTPGSDHFRPVRMDMFMRPAAAETRKDDRLLLRLEGGSLKNLAETSAAVTLQNADIPAEGEKGILCRFLGKGSWMNVTGLQTPEDAMALAFWMRIDQPADAGLMSANGSNQPEARLRNYTLHASYFRDGPPAQCDLRSVGAAEGKWMHVIISYGDTVSIYANGELRAQVVKSAPDRNAYVRDLTLFQGQHLEVDGLRIYNRTLDAAAAAALFQETRAERTQGEQP